uniref:ABC transporter domain-containing protein n=1 Tax=Arcella intermedia TaxID=1963864 RepID=A0A6B2L0T3_9EUKA
MRVQQVIREVRLEKVLKTKIGDEFTQGISGGQKRRLSIAIELLNLPSILLLDEPTSGLDANSAHNLVLLLKDLAISHQRTIVTTIHSPRPESFAVFDSILLLGENGTVVYFGPASNAIKYFNNNGFKADSYQSPGDFIIDAVGLNPEVETKDIFDDQMVALDDSEDSNAHLYEEAKLTKPVKSTKVLSSIWNASQEQKELVKDIKKNYLKKNEDEPYKKNTNKIGFWHQTLVLFSRRVSRSGISDQLSLFAQVFSVGIVLAFAFKGQGFEDINIFYRPYKAVMFIVTVTSYAMIVQYLVNVPMFLGERNILRREIENGSSGVGSYILSSLIYEVPISILQVMLLTALGYWLVDLNSEASHVLYYGLVTIIGVAAWQSLVCLASFVTNRIGLVYSICFVFLGLGTLCGGLLIIYHNLPAVFIPFFYSSIPALTYRTLLHNDLQCCYMFLSCTDVDALAVKYVELPPFVAQMDEVCKVNSTTVMNLGGMALQFLDMSNEREAINIAALVGFFLIGRLAAVGIFKIKSYWEYNMKDQTQQDFVGVSKAFLKKKKTGKL